MRGTLPPLPMRLWCLVKRQELLFFMNLKVVGGGGGLCYFPTGTEEHWTGVLDSSVANVFSGTWGPFPGGKARPGRDADHSPHLVPRS
jgi:hypothetical protein